MSPNLIENRGGWKKKKKSEIILILLYWVYLCTSIEQTAFFKTEGCCCYCYYYYYNYDGLNVYTD